MSPFDSIEYAALELGDVVHYLAHGSADDTYPMTCRVGIITDLAPEDPDPTEDMSDPERLAVAVLNPTGMFFHQAIYQDETQTRGGTWHYAEHRPLLVINNGNEVDSVRDMLIGRRHVCPKCGRAALVTIRPYGDDGPTARRCLAHGCDYADRLPTWAPAPENWIMQMQDGESWWVPPVSDHALVERSGDE